MFPLLYFAISVGCPSPSPSSLCLGPSSLCFILQYQWVAPLAPAPVSARYAWVLVLFSSNIWPLSSSSYSANRHPTPGTRKQLVCWLSIFTGTEPRHDGSWLLVICRHSGCVATNTVPSTAQVEEKSIKAMDLLIMRISRGFHPNYGNNSEAKLMKNTKKIIFSFFVWTSQVQ